MFKASPSQLSRHIQRWRTWHRPASSADPLRASPRWGVSPVGCWRWRRGVDVGCRWCELRSISRTQKGLGFEGFHCDRLVLHQSWQEMVYDEVSSTKLKLPKWFQNDVLSLLGASSCLFIISTCFKNVSSPNDKATSQNADVPTSNSIVSPRCPKISQGSPQMSIIIYNL